MATTFSDVQTMFHTMPRTRYEIPIGLQEQWLVIAVAEFELNIGTKLNYDNASKRFANNIGSAAILTLANIMYRQYLTRELSRVAALNGIYTKDINLTGQDATKRVTQKELEDQASLCEVLLNRQKENSFN